VTRGAVRARVRAIRWFEMTGRGQRKPLSVIARSSCDVAIQSSGLAPGLLRGACHRARIRATRWLAMTGRDQRKTSSRHCDRRVPDIGLARWQDRLTPIWKHVAGGCHLNRKPDDLMQSARLSDRTPRKQLSQSATGDEVHLFGQRLPRLSSGNHHRGIRGGWLDVRSGLLPKPADLWGCDGVPRQNLLIEGHGTSNL
jgi:hypothetical protein